MRLGEAATNDARGRSGDHWASEWKKYGAFTFPFNVSGHPAISLPLEFAPSGLPIGMQVVAGHGRERSLLRLAAQLEGVREWTTTRPDVLIAGSTATG